MVHACVAMLCDVLPSNEHAHGERGHGTQPRRSKGERRRVGLRHTAAEVARSFFRKPTIGDWAARPEWPKSPFGNILHVCRDLLCRSISEFCTALSPRPAAGGPIHVATRRCRADGCESSPGVDALRFLDAVNAPVQMATRCRAVRCGVVDHFQPATGQQKPTIPPRPPRDGHRAGADTTCQ